MSKPLKAILLLVLVLSLLLIFVHLEKYRSASNEYSLLLHQLDDSTEKWNQINQDKIALQSELKELTEQLREAELTIEESDKRSDELQQDIAQLESDIESMKKDLGLE